ncbi:hypothetical protein ILYODFUR_034193 [Ilyodon furcidens]|uniref:Uncharacterized protein n=1 Tax=Ilyodon furcidens TaxID=33524 RepID=A0ABV0T3N9_9TELE
MVCRGTTNICISEAMVCRGTTNICISEAMVCRGTTNICSEDCQKHYVGQLGHYKTWRFSPYVWTMEGFRCKTEAIRTWLKSSETLQETVMVR